MHNAGNEQQQRAGQCKAWLLLLQMAAQEKMREDEVAKAKELAAAVEAALSAAEPKVVEGQRCLQRTSTASMAQLVS